jgi:hypothetical protein
MVPQVLETLGYQVTLMQELLNCCWLGTHSWQLPNGHEVLDNITSGTQSAHAKQTLEPLQVSVVPEGSDLLPGGYTVLMRLPRSYTQAAQSDFLVDLLVMHQRANDPLNDPLASARSGEPAHTSTACRHCHGISP